MIKIDGELVGGIIPQPYLDFFNPLKEFKLWVANTNFHITVDEAKIIDEQIEGVEVFKVFSPYKFLLGVGKMFEFRDVRMAIEKAICHDIKEYTLGDIDSKMLEMADELQSNYEHWAIYAFPNGELTSVQSNDENDYIEQRKVLDECESLSEGVLLESE